MSYTERYILTFVSERGNDYKIVVLQKDYTGDIYYKKLGVAPTLSIEEGDGRIKGSSLSFSIQADVEGELVVLYTTNNKEFRVLLYRNDNLYWQGYLLPELYSENYIDPPYDIAVTASDQLAVLKDLLYEDEDVEKSIFEIIQTILGKTQIDLPVVTHLQITTGDGKQLLQNSYINAAAMNGKSCYDALNALLISCNACIMLIENEWLVTSLTDASTDYFKDNEIIQRPHTSIGRMYRDQAYPIGSLQMMNAPAKKGADVEYAHILKNSMLKNADCTNRDYWRWTPYTVNTAVPAEIPDPWGVVQKCYAWGLYKTEFSKDSSLHLWQDIELLQDDNFNYNLSFKYYMTVNSDKLLLAIMHIGDDGVTRRLTANGWESGLFATDKNAYIEVTGKNNPTAWIWDIANIEKYEEVNISFTLPQVSGKLRIGFINYGEEESLLSLTYITRVYLTIQGVNGKKSTSLVEQNATSAQEQVMLSYGDKQESANAPLIVLNTLNDASGVPIENWAISSKEYSSYFLMMLQDYSRYFGSKKMQLQGNIMGANLLRPFYTDAFSGKVMRLVSYQYNLLDDSLSLTIEEVITAFVNYEVVVYATENKEQNTSSVQGGSSAGNTVAQNGCVKYGEAGQNQRLYQLPEAEDTEAENAYLLIDEETFSSAKKISVKKFVSKLLKKNEALENTIDSLIGRIATLELLHPSTSAEGKVSVELNDKMINIDSYACTVESLQLRLINSSQRERTVTVSVQPTSGYIVGNPVGSFNIESVTIPASSSVRVEMVDEPVSWEIVNLTALVDVTINEQGEESITQTFNIYSDKN